ncbi:F-box only protein 15-like [Salvelinus sp. IW2-2015]|uniref:F-box only protein 15-like n=1 Tax=Salvelinus sp. IW2-2015 TaxID=2691554 RepID=UPI000CDF876A|nr:F-box only protein 15-like [Salvelinus alpinus]
MAIGRGQLFRSFREGLLKNAPLTEGRGPTGKENSRLCEKMTGFSPATQSVEPPTLPQKKKRKKKAAKATVPCQPVGPLPRVPTKSTGHAGKPAECTPNHIERMPPEILLKILSYLDALSLFSIGFINKRFYEMAHNNGMWHKMYSAEYGHSKKWRPKRLDEVLDKLSAVVVQERPEGYWRRLYFRTMAGFNETKWRKELRDINPFTGLPSQTERIVRSQRVTWEITVSDKWGLEGTFEQSRAYFSDSSVTVCWSSGRWPSFHQLSTLQLDGVKRQALSSPNINKPGWRSLMAKFDRDTISKSGQVIGRDQLVTLVLFSPSIVIGVWRGRWSIAFVMASFHYHRLVERSLLGTSMCPYSMPENKPPFDDADPDSGLHGYTLRIILHNTVTQIMAGHFSQLYCSKSQVHGGFIQLNVINRGSLSQHTPLSGRISLPWKCEALEGTVENCCMMSLTLMDEYQNPFWCVSTPVSMALNSKEPSNDYEGQHFLIKYQDAEGKVRMDLVWLEEQRQYFLINLVVFIATAKVNKHFGRAY